MRLWQGGVFEGKKLHRQRSHVRTFENESRLQLENPML